MPLYMDNLQHYRIVDERHAVVCERRTRVIALLYIGTFGSFTGFSSAFGQVPQMNLMASGQGAAQASVCAAQIAFVGPLLGSLSASGQCRRDNGPLGLRASSELGLLATARSALPSLAASPLWP